MVKIDIDNKCYLECSVVNREPSIKVFNENETVNWLRGDKHICMIHSGELKYYTINNENTIGIDRYITDTFSDSEKAISFYTQSYLFNIYFNLDTGYIQYLKSDRE